MTVGKLIKMLQSFPKNMQVRILPYDTGFDETEGLELVQGVELVPKEHQDRLGKAVVIS